MKINSFESAEKFKIWIFEISRAEAFHISTWVLPGIALHYTAINFT